MGVLTVVWVKDKYNNAWGGGAGSLCSEAVACVTPVLLLRCMYTTTVINTKTV